MKLSLFGQKPAAEDEPFRSINVDEAKTMLAGGEVEIIDVREPWEYNAGHVPGARLAPLNTLLRQPKQFLTRDNLIFICASGQRSMVASEMAASLGYKQVYNVSGGTDAWRRKGYPIEK